MNDALTASKILFLEKMNPYIASLEDMVVMYDDEIRDENNVIGFAQTRLLGEPKQLVGQERVQYHELASLYVKPSYRNRGVGSEIVRNLLEKFDKKYSGRDNSIVETTKHVVCLLTLKPTTSFYSKFGFQICSQNNIPSPLGVEYHLGRLISFFLKNDLVCMVRRNDFASNS